MIKLRFNARPIGISNIYEKGDARLTEKVEIHCKYAGKGIFKNKICHKTVSVTKAEKEVIEAIAMRLFLDHKKVVMTEDTEDGKVKVVGVIAVDTITKE